MTFKPSLIGAALIAATSFSGGAHAGLTGNVGVFSEYLFRGVEQSNGASVQGGVDYAMDSGLYAGLWMSNLDDSLGFGSYETDIYAGYTMQLGDFTLDGGLLYYYYADVSAPNTLELYVGTSAFGANAKLFVADDYFGTGEAALYLTANYPIEIAEGLSLTPQVGFSQGDGVQALYQDDYVDYSLLLSKSLQDDITFSLGAFGTSINGDDIKLVLGAKKAFNLM